MKQRLILRLDDAATRMDIDRWQQMENLLDKYSIKPLVGVIPNCQDPMMEKYPENSKFWDKVHSWIDKGWIIAMHGYRHVYDSENGGINPVNNRSEFAGHTYEEQARRIRAGFNILNSHNIHPKIFFAPSHTFDNNTLEALKNETDIRIISDTPAWDIYKMNDFVFIPQQSGCVRKLPFRTVTFCYHPNGLDEQSIALLEAFFRRYSDRFVTVDAVINKYRDYNWLDRVINSLYFVRRFK